MMTFYRFKIALKSLHRFIEIIRCVRDSKAPFREILAYLQLRKLSYPYKIHLKNGLQLELENWQDLTTAWVVFFGNEYTIEDTDSIIVDLGANIGAFSLYAAYVLPQVKIFAVEPFPPTYTKLCENIEDNRLSSRIDCLNAASVGKSRAVYMNTDETIPSHSRKTNAPKGIEIQGLSIKDIMDRFGINRVSLLKIDIEGAEYELFKETPDEVLRCMDRIGVEYHGNGSTPEMIHSIKEAGFRVERHPKKGTSGVIEFVRIEN